MFEPLKQIIGEGADKMVSAMAELRDVVAMNTEAQIERKQSTRKTISIGKAKEEGETVIPGEAELRNDTGYGWKLKWVACASGEVFIYLGTNTAEGFTLAIEQWDGKEVDLYLPPGGIVFLKNEHVTQLGIVNLEVDVMLESAHPGHTGRSNERTELQRVEPIPSGTPLDDVQVQ